MGKSKDKGTLWETAICRYLAEHGFPHVERRALTGSHDRGDISGILSWVIEAKNCSTASLGVWMDEALTEQAHDGADYAAVWHHRRGKASPADGYVTMTGAQFTRLIRQAGYGTPESRDAGTVHLVYSGAGMMACCGRTPWELPGTDRMTADRLEATCQGAEV